MTTGIVYFIIAFIGGMGLGFFYFLGLWLTVRSLPLVSWPAILAFSSFVGRMEEKRQQIIEIVKSQLADDLTLSFETSADLICGIELTELWTNLSSAFKENDLTFFCRIESQTKVNFLHFSCR
jgi:hypothetical protein